MKTRKRITNWLGRNINRLALVLGVIVLLGFLLQYCTGCASPPAPETVRAPAEIHAEGLAYGDNISDWPFGLAYEFKQSHYAHVVARQE